MSQADTLPPRRDLIPAFVLVALLGASTPGVAGAQQGAPQHAHAATPPSVPLNAAVPAPVGFRSGLTQGAGVTDAWVLEGGTSAAAVPAAAGAGHTATWRAGELLLHVPVQLARLPRIELRLGGGSYQWQAVSGSTSSAPAAPRIAGRGDASVGAMVDLRRGTAAAPSIAGRMTLSLSADAALPTGNLPDRDRTWRPVSKVLAGLPLTDRTALAASAAAAVSGPAGSHYGQGSASLWATHRWTSRLGSYAETKAESRPEWDGGARALVHGGLTMLMTPASHLDVHLGAPVRGGRGAFGGLGLMHRL